MTAPMLLIGGFAAVYGPPWAPSDGVPPMARAELAQSWVSWLRGAFYGPSAAPRGGATTNKYLELETTLITAFTELHGDYERHFWDFIVDVILALAREPPSTVAVAVSVGKTMTNTLVAGAKTQSQAKAKAKPRRPRGQPNAPLAYVVISALRKTCDVAEGRTTRDSCVAVGRVNAELRAFCHSALRDPTSMDQKLFVEILELFCIVVEDSALLQNVATQLIETKSHSALIKLCQTYDSPGVWDYKDIIRAMIRSKDWGSAEMVARTFDKSSSHQLARVLIEMAIASQEFKRAHRIVFNFGLQHDFPDIDMLYSRDALLKLIEKQKWTLALSFVGSDQTLQRVLLSHMIAAGELQHASYLARERLGLVDFDPNQYAESAAAHHRENSTFASLPVHGYLELEVDHEHITFCNSTESAHAAFSALFDELGEDHDDLSVVGLDVEWRPTSTKIANHTGVINTSAVASILQIATQKRIILLDLLELYESDIVLDEYLHRLLRSSEILKVGFGFDSDLKVLHHTFPDRKAFRQVMPFLELSNIVQKCLGAYAGISLSNATNRILGKPLDKRMQLSNWEDRPLSHSQITYAALDAYCLLQIVAHIRQFGLKGDTSVTVHWADMQDQIGTASLSSPIDDLDVVEELTRLHKEYRETWKLKQQRHGQLEVKNLRTLQNVRDDWENVMKSSSEVLSEKQQLQVLPVDNLDSLLDTAQHEPQSYIAINSICFFADERPCVACIDANAKLDTSRLATLCSLSRRKIKLASAMECEAIWGFSPGTVPPFGHRQVHEGPQPISVFVDIGLRNHRYWIAGSGSHEHLLVLPSSVYFKVFPIAAVADIALRRGTYVQINEDETISASDDHEQESSEAIEYKFLADTMVVRVGRWLRTIGIDVILWDNATAEVMSSCVDRKSALLQYAAREHRIVLTRDKKLADRRDAGACFVVSSDDPHQQFQEIKAHFALELKKEEMMTRCAKCNFKGFDIVDRDYVLQQTDDVVHERVLEVVTEFWKCASCHKIYWEGPKYNSAYENMLQMFDEATVQ